MVVDDQTVLGRVLGAAEAARLRAGFRDLLQRVARRARSPEERDQLMDRLRRLDPDDWVDETAVRAGVSTVEAEWEAIQAALPQRRRGRRGGRRREQAPEGPSAPVSAIMVENGDVDEHATDLQEARSDVDSGPPGDSDPVGRPEPDDLPGDD
jgi:hypothetical protein